MLFVLLIHITTCHVRCIHINALAHTAANVFKQPMKRNKKTNTYFGFSLPPFNGKKSIAKFLAAHFSSFRWHMNVSNLIVILNANK